MDNQQHNQEDKPTTPRQSSSAFVYPVRSLLEGRFQPHPLAKAAATSRSSNDVSSLVSHSKAQNSSAKPPTSSRLEFVTGSTSSIPQPLDQKIPTQVPNPSSKRSKSTRPRAASASSLPPTSPGEDDQRPLAKSKRKKSKSKASPNFSHFPAGHNPYFPHTFSSFHQEGTASQPTSLAHMEEMPSSMSAQEVHGQRIHAHLQGIYDLTSAPLPIALGDALAMSSPSLLPGFEGDSPPRSPWKDDLLTDTAYSTLPDIGLSTPSVEDPQTTPSFTMPPQGFCPDVLATPIAQYPGSGSSSSKKDKDDSYLPFNLSEFGLVHLPPLPISRSASDRASPAASSGHRSRQSIGNSSNSKSSNLRSTCTNSMTGSGNSSNYVTALSGLQSGKLSSNRSQKESSSEVFSSETGSNSFNSEEPYVSFRFQSMQDENGNHVVVGREGKLLRCEDEPIHTPGAVQGFGVLIAVDEKEDTLVVRQVSENSTELLGLPPRYLFGLECFTDTLPDAQATLLWDNIEFLTDPTLHSEDEESSPHIFLLSGLGAPGSALPHELDAVDGKKLWTCWCAVHRAGGPAASGLIIMEFELERDIFNPLYPPIFQVSRHTSGVVSPSSSGHGGSDETTGTFASDRQESPETGSDQSTAGRSSSNAGSTPSLLSTLTSVSEGETSPPALACGDGQWLPGAEDIIESTTSRSKPLPALERLRRMTRGATSYGNATKSISDDNTAKPNRRTARRATARGTSAVGMMDVFAVMAQINEQLGAATDLNTFLKVVVGVVKDLTQFHRVMVYQFDELWNGQVMAELVDWSQSHDLFKGLHFPASDIPAQARQLYTLNKVRLLYDVSQPTARIVVRNRDDLETPLDMTYCYLRAMSPIHITYLKNMGVKASMSVSLMGFGQLWGLVTCHSYGQYGMRVSFPVRQMLRLLSQSISKNIERLSYAQRLHTRKLINHMASPHHPSGYLVSNADDLLSLFDADFGILVIGEGAKILGPNEHGQEVLIMAEYLRLKQFDTIQASQSVLQDFPDLNLTMGSRVPLVLPLTFSVSGFTGFEIIAGLLYIPLSSGGKDFIAFLRRGQPRQVHWAGRPHKYEEPGKGPSLEPRKSFKTWSETVAGRSRMWTDEQVETAGVVALLYGKFIEVWREKENALQANKLTNLLLSNASHEVRTPLNHIINYLEMAMNGPLDVETRDNLSKSHAASKSLLFTINDLLDLTRLESGNETFFNEPFNLHTTIEDATQVYRKEAARRGLKFNLDLLDSPTVVVGDAKKIRTVVQNLTANALKYTSSGSITVSCRTYDEPEGLRRTNQTAVEILVADTGAGIPPEKLEHIFREFEQVETMEAKENSKVGVGLGLAVVARIVEQLGGQLRVESTVNEGSRFSFLIPLSLSVSGPSSSAASRSSTSPRPPSNMSTREAPWSQSKEMENLVNALSSSHLYAPRDSYEATERRDTFDASASRPPLGPRRYSAGVSDIARLGMPTSPARAESYGPGPSILPTLSTIKGERRLKPVDSGEEEDPYRLRVLIVEDNDINRTILAKRLTLNGHTVVNTTNGQECLDKVIADDKSFDIVLMDIQMPIMNGLETTRRIRDFEKDPKNQKPRMQRRRSEEINGRMPVFAVSASLREQQREELAAHGVDGWILKPIDFKRLNTILKGVTDPSQRHKDVYKPGCSWEAGGWLKDSPTGPAA